MEEQVKPENKMRTKIKKFRKATQIVVVAVALVATGVIFYFVGYDSGWGNAYQYTQDYTSMASPDSYDYDYDYNYSADDYTSTTPAHKWTCDRCKTEWEGTAYYGGSTFDTLCAECANRYWSPFPISNYTKPEE